MPKKYAEISIETLEILDFKRDQEDLEYLLEHVIFSNEWKDTQLWHVAKEAYATITDFRDEMDNALDFLGAENEDE